MKELSISLEEYEELLNNGKRDNANLKYSAEQIHKYTADMISKQYALIVMPDEVAEAHKQGYLHIHDMEYYATRPNCCNWDIRFFIKNGLKIDGTGDNGSVSKPAKSLEVMVHHITQMLMAGAVTFSGGQGLCNFNTLIAPFCHNRSYKDIKQAMQSLVFSMNQALVCRGGQVLFSSLALDLSTPDVLADEPAVGPGGVEIGTYKDYSEEANLVFKAMCEVIGEKDAWGRYFTFPNLLFNIRSGDLDQYEGNCRIMMELGADVPTVYYNNCKTLERSTMGCRTSLPLNFTGDYEKDCMNTGNFAYTTLNLPLIALDAKNDIKRFYELLDHFCELAYKGLIDRRERVIDAIYNKRMSNFLLQEDKDTGIPLYDIDRTTITLGFCGLYEAMQAIDGLRGKPVIEFLNDKKQEFNERDGLRWSVIGSPAESASHRFATIIKQKYQEATVQGVDGSYYLTNSSHIPVNAENNLVDHIRNADRYHGLTLGGNILHLWMGETWTDPEALWRLTQKILDTNTIFWDVTKDFSHCRKCNFNINKQIDYCPLCGSEEVEIFSRITGYYQNVSSFNNGKRQEFKERYRHKL